MSDVVAAIDAAIGCQYCEAPLGDSPSDDFCGQDCQMAWHAAHVTPLPDGELVTVRGYSLEIIRFENGPQHGDSFAVAAPAGCVAVVPEHTRRAAQDDEHGSYLALYRLVVRDDGRRVYEFERAAHMLPLPEGFGDVLAGIGRAASAAAQGFADLARAMSPPDGA